MSAAPIRSTKVGLDGDMQQKAYAETKYASVEQHPLSRLADRELPRPNREEDVEVDFDRWLSGNVVSDVERYQVLEPDYMPTAMGGSSLGRRERTLAELFQLLQTPIARWRTPNGCRALVDRIEAIATVLAPAATVLTHLKKKAAAYVSEECERLCGEPARLVVFLGRIPLKMRGESCVLLPFGGAIALSKLVECAAGNGLHLWHLRSLMKSDVRRFDEEVVTRRSTITPGLRAGLRSLFREGDECTPTPREFLAAFQQALPGAEAIAFILEELYGTKRVMNGLSATVASEVWFDALAGLSGWTPATLRMLVHLDDRSPKSCDARIQTILAALAEIADAFPQSGTFAALHVLHVARRLREEGRHLADAERQCRLRERVRSLHYGKAILALDEHVADLPLGIPGEDCTWNQLGKGSKGQWHFNASSTVAGDTALAHGLAEFLFAFATKDAFEDVEPLIADLLSDDKGVDFLDTLEFSSDRITVLRAGEVRRSLLSRDPAA